MKIISLTRRMVSGFMCLGLVMSIGVQQSNADPADPKEIEFDKNKMLKAHNKYRKE